MLPGMNINLIDGSIASGLLELRARPGLFWPLSYLVPWTYVFASHYYASGLAGISRRAQEGYQKPPLIFQKHLRLVATFLPYQSKNPMTLYQGQFAVVDAGRYELMNQACLLC